MASERHQSGYSLLEMMVAIVVLTVAILPMAGIFDAAVRTTGTGGDYDAARSGVAQTLEEARALNFDKAVSLYGGAPPTCDATGKFTCRIESEFVGEELTPDPGSKTRMLVTVTYEWDGNEYEGQTLLTEDAP